MNDALRPCPECGGGKYKPPRGPSSFYLICFILGGWILGAIYIFSRRQRIECTTCGRPYEIDTPRAKMFRRLLIAIWISFLIGVVSFMVWG